MKVSVIIPSLNPDNKLIQVVDALVAKGFDDIILVNDGSDKAHMQPFLQLKEYRQCTVLTHEINRGKGRGLKTAFDYCIANRPDIDGVVTVDGDNQHKAEDILNCCNKMIECKDKVILGVRDFSGDDVPPKSNRKDPWDYDKELYKQRNQVERLFRRIKRFRRIFTRYDKLDIIFLAFVFFALIVDVLM